MISKSSKYAIQALLYIVNNSSEEQKLLAKDIAKATKVPKPYLSKILQQLTANNYLSSSKGPGGGYFVRKEQLKISILDIIVDAEGKDKFSQCILNFKNCDAQNPCPIHEFIAPSKTDLQQRLKFITLDDLKQKGNLML